MKLNKDFKWGVLLLAIYIVLSVAITTIAAMRLILRVFTN